MLKQPDNLFSGDHFPLVPDTTQTEPRLWVRRLAIWREGGQAPIRDFSFQPGLNIVWSLSLRDTAGEENVSIGHGSGKTLLCRLIRYCMGERRFAPEDVRSSIGVPFLEGIVGAEVILDGVCWAVARPLGHRQRHVAIPDGNLDAIAAGEGAHTGIEPLIAAIERAFFTPDSAGLIPGSQGWLTQLAWLSRDQECGFVKLQDWRDNASGSESPARGLINDDAKFFAVRVFLQAITSEEVTLGEEIKTVEPERDRTKNDLGHLFWEVNKSRKRLGAEMGLSPEDMEGPLAIEALKQSARKKLAVVAGGSTTGDLGDPEALEERLQEAEKVERELGERLAAMKARREEKEKSVNRMQKEVFGLALSTDAEENPSCPICSVPIDRVLATRCNLSHKLADLESVRQKRETHRQALEGEQRELSKLAEDLTVAEQEHQAAKTQAAAFSDELDQIKKANAAHSEAWYEARRLIDDVARYERLLSDQKTAGDSLVSLNERLDGKREQMKLFRERQTQFVTKFSTIFHYVVQQLVGDAATGSVRITGNGLEAKIHMGGDRETPGIKCIKVLAFDLAALCLSTEKNALIAPFFIHDSPRTADLDIEVYSRLFEFVKNLPAKLGRPTFQYIITTTTPPPRDLQNDNWTRVRLKGAPADQRLLKVDL